MFGCMNVYNKAMRVSAQVHMSLQEHVPCLSPIFPKDSFEEYSLLGVYFTVLPSLGQMKNEVESPKMSS